MIQIAVASCLRFTEFQKSGLFLQIVALEVLQNRGPDFLDELRCKPYCNVAVFAHGGVLICAELYSGRIKEEEAFDALLPYGSELTVEL